MPRASSGPFLPPGHARPLVSHELFRRAKDRHLIPQFLADPGQPSGTFGVRDVAAVPRQQIVHSVYRRNRDVECVRHGFRRYRTRVEELPCDIGDFLCNAKDRKPFQLHAATGSGIAVSLRVTEEVADVARQFLDSGARSIESRGGRIPRRDSDGTRRSTMY